MAHLTKVRDYLRMRANEHKNRVTMVSKSIERDFGEGFLFSVEALNVTEEDLKRCNSGNLKEPCDHYQFGKYDKCDVLIYTDGYYPKVVRICKDIPTFDSGDREYDSWHDLYLVQEKSGDIHAIYCTGGYHIALIQGYKKVYKLPGELEKYFTKD